MNYIINELGVKKKEDLKKFIDIFFFQLLKSEKITKEYNIKRLLGLESSIKSNTCSKNIEANIIEVFNDIDHNDNVQYFSCFNCIDAFWRVEILEVNNELRLKVNLHNAECIGVINV